MSSLPDRYDHHPRLFPYLLAGLYDEDDGIRKICLEVIEEAGLEEEKAKVKLYKNKYNLFK